MKKLLRLGALLLLCVPAHTIRAEGSRELTPNTSGTTANLTLATNTRAGYLTHDFNNIVAGQYQSQGFLKPSSWSGGTNRPFSADYRLRVRLKAGETLFYGVHRIASAAGSGNQNDLILTLKYNSGATETQAQSTTLARNTGSSRQTELLAAPGVITNAAQVQAGPQVTGTASASTGYNPLIYTNNTGADRDFWVEFTQVGEGAMSQGQKVSQYDFWDFTVRSNAGATGQELRGRLRSKFWSFSTDSFTNLLSATFSLYPLVESVRQPGRYYVKEVELAGMNPYAFYFVSNANGTSQTGSFANARKSQTSEQTYPEYDNFVNDPDPALWPSAPLPVFSRTVQPFCNPLTGRGSAAFTTLSEEAGSTSVLIDINNNGVQDGNDVVIEQTVAANVPATVFWNGLDNANTPVAAGTTLRLTFVSNGAPVNFPLFDVEGNTDGVRVQNVRPSQGNNRFFDRLYWDDRNLPTAANRFPATRPAPDLSNYRPDGVISETGVHRWSGANTNQGGDNYTVNTWTYGFISAAAEQVYTFDFNCDFDKDGIPDKDDIDDDNDGILDVVEMYGLNPQTQTANGVATTNGDGVLIYLDAAYVHPVLGAFRDLNADGINDIFDTDGDGIPNNFDLDADGDGLPDAFEANGNRNPSASFSQAVNGGSKTSAYNPARAQFMAAATATAPSSVGANGLPDAIKGTISYKNNGTVSTENGVSQYVLGDQDNDRRTANSQTVRNYNFLDLDSDNDGITDEIEAQPTATYITRKGQANFTTDANKNGIRDAYEGAGALTAVVNTDNAGQVDMFDADSDGDNAGHANQPIYQHTADWTEGFDTNKNGTAGEELLAKARAFALANPAKASYYVVTTNGTGYGGTTQSGFLQDSDADGIPNFADLDSPYYHDDNFNGLVDLHDPAFGGQPSLMPMNADNSEAIFRTNATAVPLPVTLLGFQAQAASRDALLTWATAQELNNASFVVERSADGVAFAAIATLPGRGTSTQRTDYRHLDRNAGARAGVRYYRLRQNDTDGKLAYSSIRTVTFDGTSTPGPAGLFPNPTPAATTLDLTLLPVGSYRVEILSADGRTVAELSATGGELNPLGTQALAKGLYLVRISGPDVRQTLKLVKE
ncbi:T9SS type A sorting domain-containing protein [Hymenobacter rubripertinctus]|uniref:T9SS C-terminal target domain-containing protein n=1 Tax=Hymenobacter rubripertinctus TaxID=2029981 RepID=A0A418QML5_9BACT|nr:T9SS type A sorting domain-containing protein [Hymenobacter rubripertinctus]RIY06372.1 T9SS C-terminal target domain-containing protein [Hymenobacter rubripertinctus]